MAKLSIGVLGSLQIQIADTPVEALESVKVRALLAYLIVESDRPHSRDTLVGLLWPGYTEESARHNLRQALFNLRSILGDQTADPPYLLITRSTIQFNRDSDYSLDLHQFNHYFFTCEENLDQCMEDCSIHAANLEEMVKLYRGEFLQQLYVQDSPAFEEWIVVQRESLHQRVMEAHRYLANYYELHSDYQAARKHASHQLELDPWREEAHRQMMRVLALEGQRSAALAQYETCRKVLAEELDVEPSVETRELYEKIRLGSLKQIIEQPPDITSVPINNLPVQLTPFIGREQERIDLGQHVTDPECRCITLIGPGGIGKTRLAVQVAEDHLNEFIQGATFVPLASVESTDGVIPAIASAINFAFYGPGDPKIQLLSYLREKEMLLVLDNIEQLLTESPDQENLADLLIEILQNAPRVKLLITTRETLNMQEECLFEVQGLTYPEGTLTNGFEEYDAIALFTQRARRASPKFAMNAENREEVAHICRLVEGMPLAIELAATWMRILSPAEIAKEIEDSLDFLSSSVRDLPERHRSMRVVFDYSWEMLGDEEQLVLSKLSVFRGGFQRNAAEQVAGATLTILSTLVNRSLLKRTAPGRYDLHELIRQYSSAHLIANPQTKNAAQGQHCTYFLAMAEHSNEELHGSNQLVWLSRLEQEHDNLRAAFEWALEDDSASNGDEKALRLSSALRWYWRMLGHFHEGRDWLTEALRRSPGRQTSARAGALLGISLLINALGDLGAARAPAEESVKIYRQLNEQNGLAEALVAEGLNLVWLGESSLCHDRTNEGLAIYRKIGDRWGEAHAMYRLGSYLADYTGSDAGKVMLEESAAISEDLGDKYLLTSILISLGMIDISKGNYNLAQQRLEHCLDVTKEIRYPWGLADVLTNLGCLYRIKGEYARAKSLFEEALQVYQEHMHNVWITDVLCALTENALSQGDLPAARSHIKAATNLLGSFENKWLHVLVWYFQGLVMYYEGDIESAAELLCETVSLARKGQFLPDLARSLVTLGRVRLKQGEIVQATEIIQEGLRLFMKIGHKLSIAIALEALANVNMVRGDCENALMLFTVAHNLREQLGAPLPPIDRSTYDAALAASQAQLGEANFTAFQARAHAKPVEALVEDILRGDE